MYKDLAGFVTRLTGNITSASPHLPIPMCDYELLLDELADGDHSYLEIREKNTIEIVKVKNVCDKLVIERGKELTRPMAFRCGTSVAFALTMQGVMDTVCQMTDSDCYPNKLRRFFA